MIKRLGRSGVALTLLVCAASEDAVSADLAGGDCCADLEERIAELEATTVRKGNRKVSLAMSGFVSHNVMWWDDGTQGDVYIGDGARSASRFQFIGSAKITPEITAGFLYEFGFNNNGVQRANQLNGGDDLGAVANVRHSAVWLKHKALGEVRIGQTSTATDDLIEIDLSGCGRACTADIAQYGGGFLLRGKNGQLATDADTQWRTAIQGHESWDTDRRNVVRYESPTLAGFFFNAAVGEDNFWDVALRYAGEHGAFKIAGGIGYLRNTEFNTPLGALNGCAAHCDTSVTDIKGAVSIQHVPTGLFATVAGGHRSMEGGLPLPGALDVPDLRFYHAIFGVTRNFTGMGLTTLFGEYGQHMGGLAQDAFIEAASAADCNAVNPTNTHQHSCTGDSRVTAWGFGVSQVIDAAALDVFVAYKHLSLDRASFASTDPVNNNALNTASDFHTVIVGTRMRF